MQTEGRITACLTDLEMQAQFQRIYQHQIQKWLDWKFPKSEFVKAGDLDKAMQQKWNATHKILKHVAVVQTTAVEIYSDTGSITNWFQFIEHEYCVE